MRLRTLALVCGLLVPATSLLAQQSVPANQPLQASFTHDGLRTDGYRLKVDGKSLGDIPVSQLKNGTVSLSVPGLSVGAHSLVACAYNVSGEGCASPLALDAFGPPNAPANFTITVQLALNQDGTVSVLGVLARRE